MGPISSQLKQLGIGCSLGKLTGHWEEKDRLSSFKQATPETWLKDMENFYLETAKNHPGKDLIFVGYSLGALLGVLLTQMRMARFEKMILFAPALYLRPWAYFPKLLTPLGLTLPSAMPASIRANPGTPVSAYNTLFNLVKRFDPTDSLDSALIIMDPRDELVDFSRIQSWVQHQQNVTLLPIQNSTRIKHLITDEGFVGTEAWAAMWSAAKSAIELPATRSSV